MSVLRIIGRSLNVANCNLIKIFSVVAVLFCGSVMSTYAADDLVYNDPATYSEYNVDGTTIYLHPLWLRYPHFDAYNMRETASMIVKDDIIYVCNNSDYRNKILIESYDAATGQNLGDINIQSHQNMKSLMSYLSEDEFGNPFLLNNILYDDKNLDPQISVIDLFEKSVTDVYDVDLSPISNYVGIYTLYSLGFPCIVGNVCNGEFSMLLPIAYRNNSADKFYIFIGRVEFADGIQTSVSRIDNFISSGNIEATGLPVFPHMQMLADGNILIDTNNSTPIIYSSATDSWSENLLMSDVGINAKSKGCHVFDFAGSKWMVGTAIMEQEASQYHISVWTEAGETTDFSKLSNNWMVPKDKLKSINYCEYSPYAPVSLFRTVDYKEKIGADITNLYVCAPGHGMAAYQLSKRQVSTSVSANEIDNSSIWRLNCKRLSVVGDYRSAALFTMAGERLGLFTGQSVDLRLPAGLYLLVVDGAAHKIAVR